MPCRGKTGKFDNFTAITIREAQNAQASPQLYVNFASNVIISVYHHGNLKQFSAETVAEPMGQN
jgi:hypothetical protein